MPKVINNLQILRFTAAAMVLFGHVEHEVASRNFLDKAGYVPFEPIFWPGGVDIFFVISGFIMYHLAKDQFGKPNAPLTFIIRRLVRVAPLYWLFTTLLLLITPFVAGYIVHNHYSMGQIISSYLFYPWQNPYNGIYPVLILGWTLNFEILFYAIFALGLFFKRWRGLAWISLVLLVIGLSPFAVQINTAPFAFWSNSIVIEFLFGIGLAGLFNAGTRLPIKGGLALCVAGYVAMMLLKAQGIPGTHWAWRPAWMGLPALAVCAGLVLCEPKGLPGPVRTALVFGGDASYILYLSHPMSIGATAVIFRHFGLTDPWFYIGTACLVSLMTAALLHLVLERPLNAFNHKHVTRWILARIPS